MLQNMKDTSHGRAAEVDLTLSLNKWKRKSRRMPQGYPFDLLVDGWRIEVKSATPTQSHGRIFWRFNLHHAGVLRENCDFYIVRALGVVGRERGIWFLFKAPLGRKALYIGMRQIEKGKMDKPRADFISFGHGEFGQGPGDIGLMDFRCVICGKEIRKMHLRQTRCGPLCSDFMYRLRSALRCARKAGVSIPRVLELIQCIPQKAP